MMAGKPNLESRVLNPPPTSRLPKPVNKPRAFLWLFAVIAMLAIGAGCSGDGEAACSDGESLVDGVCAPQTCESHADCAGMCVDNVCGPSEIGECDAGYTDNGDICVDDDECAGEGDGHDCDANATCTNTPGGFSCECIAGYEGDGATCTPCAIGTEGCGTSEPGAPRLFGFVVTDAERGRVYFESSETIVATTVTGFTISDRTVTGVTINGAANSGHYFSVDTDFDYFSNNTIRYEGGSDLEDTQGTALYEFTLQYIENEIAEPQANYAPPHYVRTKGNNSNNGLSHDAAFRTLAHAASTGAKIIYIEVGDYGNENVTFTTDGTLTEPILIQGYKSLTGGVPDPIAPNYWNWGDHGTLGNLSVDPNELPTFNGGDRSTGIGFLLANYMILRNIQMTGYRVGMRVRVRHHIVIDNFVGVAFGQTDSSMSGQAISAGANADPNPRPAEHCRYTNITISDVSGASFRHYGNLSLLDGVRIYNDAGNGDEFSHPDYYISMYEASNNIIRNSLADRIGNFQGSAHGIGIKGSGVPSEYNLIENSTAINQVEGIEIRHREVKFNVVRNVDIYRRQGETRPGGGIVVRDDASFNTFENSRIDNVYRALYFYDQKGEQGEQVPGHDNRFSNIAISDCGNVFASGGSNATGATSYNNIFTNITADNCNNFSGCNWLMDSSNVIENSTFSNIASFESLPSKPDPEFTISDSNFFSLGYGAPTGTNISELDPKFVDAANGDFHLAADSPLKDLGADPTDTFYDFDGVERFAGSCSIGAYERD